MKNTNFSEIILAKNPQTDKHINIMPLFYLSFQLTEKGEPQIKNIKKKIDDAIRLISTNRFEEATVEDYVKELTHSLYEISDMFEEMENF
jgi:hypothetical protein